MPQLLPLKPRFADKSERAVWEALSQQLPAEATLFTNLVLHDEREGRLEADFVVVWPMHGVAVIEAKGGHVTIDDEHLVWQSDRQRKRAINPFGQSERFMYALQGIVKGSYELRSMRMQAMVAFPYMNWWHDCPTHPRHIVIDELGLVAAADAVRTALAHGQMRASIPDFDQAAELVEILRGNVVDPTDLIAAGELLGERTNFLHDIALQQVELLEHLRLLPSYEVRGAAGTGKTFLAMQLAKKLKAEGKRVGYFCYNRMLAKFVTRMFESAQWQPRPDVVAEFHKFTGHHYTMPAGAGDHEWQVVAAQELLAAGRLASETEKFDAIIVDEAQDFRPLWWEAMSAWLRHPGDGLFVFGDADQGIFASSAVDSLKLPKISLNVNLRNPWPVADSTAQMISDPPRALDYDGPPVLFIECARGDAIKAADHMVDELFDSWHPGNIVLLTTGHQHPEHQSRVQFRGEDHYERGLWDEDEPFYATVGKFKGLERPVVVIAVDDFREGVNPADVLYVALTRATHAAVICGDPQEITAIVGEAAMADWERREYVGD